MPSQKRSPRGGRGRTRGFQARVTVTFSEVEGPPLSDFPKPACPGGGVLEPGVLSTASSSARLFPSTRALSVEARDQAEGPWVLFAAQPPFSSCC